MRIQTWLTIIVLVGWGTFWITRWAFLEFPGKLLVIAFAFFIALGLIGHFWTVPMWLRAIFRGIAGSLLGYVILLLVLYPIQKAMSLSEVFLFAVIGIGAGFFGGAAAHIGAIPGALVAAVGFSLGLTFPLLAYGIYDGIYALFNGIPRNPDVLNSPREYVLPALNAVGFSALKALEIVGKELVGVLAAIGSGAVGGRMPDRVAKFFQRILVLTRWAFLLSR